MPNFEPKFRTLVEIFEHSVSAFADRPLFGVKRDGEWRWTTYGEFGAQVNRLRAGLARLGVARGDRVAIIANNRIEWAVAAYATYGLGAAFVPMYESQLASEWEYILNDCGAKVVCVADDTVYEHLRPHRDALSALERVIVIEGEGDDRALTWQHVLDKGRDHPAEGVHPDPGEIAGYIYTSGTTGHPKGVLLTHENLASNVCAVHAVFTLSTDDRSLSFLPWAHCFGQVVELHGVFLQGASMGIAESVDKIIDNLAEVQPTLLFSVPRIFNRIYDGMHKRLAEESAAKRKLFETALANEQRRKRLEAEGRKSLVAEAAHKLFDKLVFQKVRQRFGGRLRYAFSGGAAINREVAEFIDNLGILVYEGYGLTETSPVATANWPGSRKIGSVGKPVPGVEVAVETDATGDPEQGELVIYGHNVMQGYHNLPEENEKVLTRDGGFRTGDMGYKDEDGFVYITGRVKDQYKLSNGKYVVPTPLEEQLNLSPYITNTMVYGDNKPYNVALVIPDFDALAKWADREGIHASSWNELVEHPKVRELYRHEIDKQSESFKSFETIRDITIGLEDFTTGNDMLTPTMKLKRRKVLDHYGPQLEALYEGQLGARSAA